MRIGRVVVGAVVVEVVLIALAIPLSQFGQTPVTYVAVAGSFVLPLLMAIWVARPLTKQFVLHGLLVGVVATAIFLTLNWMGRMFGPPQPPQPVAYLYAHGLKLLGGAIGGWIAQQRAASRSRLAASGPART
jgi:putative membrane protein (TIGR04086 family)